VTLQARLPGSVSGQAMLCCLGSGHGSLFFGHGVVSSLLQINPASSIFRPLLHRDIIIPLILIIIKKRIVTKCNGWIVELLKKRVDKRFNLWIIQTVRVALGRSGGSPLQ
jgi:hypothetical protein